MKKLNELLANANNAESNDEFLELAIPLIAYESVVKGQESSNLFSCILLESEKEADSELLGLFLDRIMDLVNDMDANDVSVEQMGEPDMSSRVYKEWLQRDQSLPKLSDYEKQVRFYINNNK